MTARRALAAGLALMVAATLVTRILLTMDEFDETVTQAIWRLYRFFTVWTNTLVGIACLWTAVTGKVMQRRAAGLVLAISLVGIVYHVLLASLVSFEGIGWVVDQMFHTVIPVAFALYWAAFLPKDRVRLWNILPWIAYPGIYCGYALIRAQVDGIYPYPFLNIAEKGGALVFVNVLGQMLAFGVVGLAIVAIARWMPQVQR